jgi:hypothetical protein
MWTGIFGATHFQPPPHADPGAINACWLAFGWLIITGYVFVASTVWTLITRR